MTTTYFPTELDPQTDSGFSQLKTVLVEPALIAGAAAFWFVTLPFVGTSLVCVKLWDAFVAEKLGQAAQSNPLILRRRGISKSAPSFSNGAAIRSGHI